MMTWQEAKSLLDARPFVPFRIHMTDGRSFDILHPDFVWVFRNRLDIAIPAQEAKGIVDHVERCFFLHVVRAEELQPRSVA
jgi:hypothetical protein